MKSLQSFGQALSAVWRRSRSPWALCQARRVGLAGGLLRAFELAVGGGIGQGGARKGAGRMLLTALEADVAVYPRDARDKNALIVRNGRARERPVTLGSGTAAIRGPRVPAASGRAARHSAAGAATRRPSTVTAARSTRWPGATSLTASAGASPARSCGDMRRSPSVSEVLPNLYLRGFPKDAREALPVPLGEQVSELSPDRAPRPGRRDIGCSASSRAVGRPAMKSLLSVGRALSAAWSGSPLALLQAPLDSVRLACGPDPRTLELAGGGGILKGGVSFWFPQKTGEGAGQKETPPC